MFYLLFWQVISLLEQSKGEDAAQLVEYQLRQEKSEVAAKVNWLVVDGCQPLRAEVQDDLHDCGGDHAETGQHGRCLLSFRVSRREYDIFDVVVTSDSWIHVTWWTIFPPFSPVERRTYRRSVSVCGWGEIDDLSLGCCRGAEGWGGQVIHSRQNQSDGLSTTGKPSLSSSSWHYDCQIVTVMTWWASSRSHHDCDHYLTHHQIKPSQRHSTTPKVTLQRFIPMTAFRRSIKSSWSYI